MDGAVRERLDAYAALLLARGAAHNLTAARDASAVREHVEDSLRLLPLVREPLVDVGSGGGFPGIVLAIATGARTTLVESAAKKAAFLRDVARALELPIEVVGRRAEDVGRDPLYRERFETATARAVGPATTVLELTAPLLRLGGRALLQRGAFSSAERTALADASLVLGTAIEEELVDDAARDRRVVVLRKLAASVSRFPRRAGIPAKRPLCWNGAGDA